MNTEESAQETFAERFARALEEAGTTAARLCDRLRDSGNPVSPSTLSQWRSGARRPEGAASRAVVAELERLLRLGPGELVDLIGPSLRKGPLPKFMLADPDAFLQESVIESFHALGFSEHIPMRSLSLQMVGDVDESGALSQARVQLHTKAQSGRIDRFPWFQITPEPCDEPLEFSAAGGCSLSPGFAHPNGRVFAVAVTLDHPIEPRESTVVEFTTRYPPSAGIHELRLLAGIEMQEGLLWARFPRGAVPSRIEEFERTLSQASTKPREPASTVHTVRKRFGPGYVGFRWE